MRFWGGSAILPLIVEEVASVHLRNLRLAAASKEGLVAIGDPTRT